MISRIIIFLVFAAALFFGWMYVQYGETDPCRALAVEEARRAIVPTPVAQLWTRIETSGMSSLSCTRALVQAQKERLAR